MIDQQWLTIVIVLLIVVILVDGVRRMRKAKKDSIKMSLRKHFDDDSDDDVIYGSEFPNGGARNSEAQIDKDRILKARSRYNFGDDLPAWNKDSSTDAESEGEPEHEHVRSTAAKSIEKNGDTGGKIEPSFSGEDELLDIESTNHDPDDHDVATATEEKPKTPNKPITEDASAHLEEPIQASLNLDDDVPMLMEEIESEGDNETAPTESGDNSEELDILERASDMAKTLEKPIQSVASKIEPAISEVDTHSANKPRFESKYTSHADQRGQMPQDVIVVNLRARSGDLLGSDLLPVILENGLRFGAMDIFHCHAEEDGEGDVLFSMANIVKPGVFDLASFETFETVGLSFFLTLPVSVGTHMQAFEKMVGVTQAMAESLGAELLDENRSILTRQAIEHYRERVRDFSRREQLEKNK